MGSHMFKLSSKSSSYHNLLCDSDKSSFKAFFCHMLGDTGPNFPVVNRIHLAKMESINVNVFVVYFVTVQLDIENAFFSGSTCILISKCDVSIPFLFRILKNKTYKNRWWSIGICSVSKRS